MTLESIHIRPSSLNETDFSIDISSPSFLDARIIKKITHVPTGLNYTTVGTVAECNKEIREWIESLENKDDA